MINAFAQGGSHGPVYVIFDAETGKILQTHSRFSVQENRNVEIPIEELQAQFGKAANKVDFIKHVGRLDLAKHKVDMESRKLVTKTGLVIHAKKKELTGDGVDSTVIEIHAVDEHGKLDPHFSGTVKVMTTRGKLSARAGIVELKEGRAELTLKSVNETVEKVRLSVTSTDGTASSGNLTVQFV